MAPVFSTGGAGDAAASPTLPVEKTGAITSKNRERAFGHLHPDGQMRVPDFLNLGFIDGRCTRPRFFELYALHWTMDVISSNPSPNQVLTHAARANCQASKTAFRSHCAARPTGRYGTLCERGALSECPAARARASYWFDNARGEGLWLEQLQPYRDPVVC